MKIFFFFLLFSSLIYSEVFYLQDGSILQGNILSNTEAEVTIQRFDNEGIISIPWTELLPKNRQYVQNQVGIIENKPIDITKRGVKVYLNNGDIVQGIKISSKIPNTIKIRNRKGDRTILTNNILVETSEPIPLTELYKDKELYTELLKLSNPKSPEENLEFSTILIQANLLDKAKDHLNKAKGNAELLEQIEHKYHYIEELKSKESQQAQRSQFLKYRSGHHYAKAFKILQNLQSSIPENEYQKLYAETAKKEKEYYTAEITNLWMRKVMTKINKIELKSFNEAQEYVLKKLDEEILEELAKECELPTTSISEYFRERTNKKTFQFNYQSGTFLVGLGNVEPTDYKPPRFLKNDKQIKDTEWWKSVTKSEQKDWLKAFYAENKLTKVKEELKHCPTCNGSGMKSKRRCPTCQGIGYQRSITVK